MKYTRSYLARLILSGLVLLFFLVCGCSTGNSSFEESDTTTEMDTNADAALDTEMDAGGGLCFLTSHLIAYTLQ